ncbi:MAG: nucleoside-diphosphate sugar epimerase/dehydratase [Sterolibacterium sp.]
MLRRLLAILHDLAASALAWLLAYWLRFNFDIPPFFQQGLTITLIYVVALQSAIAWGFGLYRGIWRFASLPDLKRIILAVGGCALLLPMFFYMLQLFSVVPRSVLVLYPLLLILFMGGSRFIYRSWKDGHLLGFRAVTGEPVLVLGAGEEAMSLLRELERSQQWHVVGLLDDDPNKQNSLLHGIEVLGTLEDIVKHASHLHVRQAILAMPAATHTARHRAAHLASQAGLSLLTVPSFDDLLSGRIAISQMRRVELEDLLGRDPVQLDERGLHGLLEGKVVLVTGAGGSIGSELCRQIAHYSPRLLIFLDLSEYAVYRMEQEFTKSLPQVAISCLVGDVRDEALLTFIFTEYRPHVVFHAAAYKHVPLMENENAWQALRNNVLGTWLVAEAALKHGAERFVLISTDKAVNPTNVMGASKRLAEMVCQVLSRKEQAGLVQTRFVTVRFGNVLGSSGSVIPKFREQITQGGPVTVTHPDIVRYFMLIPEAAQLVLQAGLMGQGGEIFVLDMGEPIKIIDLARDMIRLSGYTEEDIRIEFTGLRPGEKLYEELLADSETTQPTPHPKLRVARADTPVDAVWLTELRAWLDQPNLPATIVRQGLMLRVPEYRPASHGG